jgi:hypothetical protein
MFNRYLKIANNIPYLKSYPLGLYVNFIFWSGKIC